ncbi:DUF1488 family protein [Pseudoalteromonas sp. S16_S37]|uniref:DUF1488 family protein n=1 Tax=Pseudoalteromonas sp. S16_S37 TaxID=2720228 RepID=UPI001681A2EC|nr:DUF1488 family protein [Pseudoalteromonas sp. S16_S37]MBD1581900.1 DUF1488 domain-containing protein [Pseudoalteromonas sp. S16_S37]
MNQSILFNDDVCVESQTSALCFSAMVNGMMVQCRILTPPMGKEEALAHFKAKQFDYEMLAEQLIEDEEFQSDGSVLLSFL